MACRNSRISLLDRAGCDLLGLQSMVTMAHVHKHFLVLALYPSLILALSVVIILCLIC